MSSQPDRPPCTRRRSPSWAGHQPTSELASRIKRRNRKSGTKAEVILRRALWSRGLRYRLNRRDLPGTPDLVFPGPHIVVFVDGDFWHGRDWEARKKRLDSGGNASYWVSKIAYNRERDRRNEAVLREMGWLVMRFWETDVLEDPKSAADSLEAMIRPESSQST